ncbi:MAG: response regulator transcription factor [Eubacteriales bacterium]|nr:response regulator transcription factor [Eubacteriales bacterium]MDD3882024.1 response regulator transcription factor [Eubacteriales bacterium]MDD4512471.1 response regulator transcription factor [Eubacteriales bacterium]
MREKPLVLVVDDDPNISRLVQLYLEKEGYDTAIAARGEEALELFKQKEPDLLILDIMLPGIDGLEVLRRIRKDKNVPVIMLSAKDETFDKVLGLELGADDYLAKPFDSKELLARVKAVLRRTQKNDEQKDEITYPELSISLTRYEVKYRGQVVEMPPKELEVFYFLASHPNKVFTREQLLDQVWGFEFFGDSRTVDVHIKRLREKLQGSEEFGWQIRTVWSVGYKFEVS